MKLRVVGRLQREGAMDLIVDFPCRRRYTTPARVLLHGELVSCGERSVWLGFPILAPAIDRSADEAGEERCHCSSRSNNPSITYN